jgi:DNA-directed RNA polymerase subunit RPC12/RpoP
MTMSGLQWFGIGYWIVKGVWWPFVACLPAVAVMGVLVTRMYHRNTLYLCPACGGRFRPSMREMLWAHHTPKTRKLTCTRCGANGWCVETFGRETEKNEGGN